MLRFMHRRLAAAVALCGASVCGRASILRRKLVLVSAASVSLLVGPIVVAQPPVGPDPLPPEISPEQLSDLAGGPTLVTLKHDNARPERLFEALAEQAGILLDPYDSTTLLKKLPPLSIAIEAQPFLVALQTLASRVGVAFTLKNPTGFAAPPSGMMLQLQQSDDPQMHMSGPAIVRGPFVVIATALERTRSVALVGDAPENSPPAARDEAILDFVVFADPKLRVMGVQGAPIFISEGEWQIRSADEEGVWGVRSRQQGQPFLEWRFRARCKLPPDARRTPPFAARATKLLVTTNSAEWVIPDVSAAKDASKEVPLAGGQRRYMVNAVTASGNTRNRPGQETYAVNLSVTGIGVTKGRWSGWPPLTAADIVGSFRLVDSAKHDYRPQGYELKNETFTGTFSNDRGRASGPRATGPAEEAIWKLPTEIRMVSMPVDFAALPLP